MNEKYNFEKNTDYIENNISTTSINPNSLNIQSFYTNDTKTDVCFKYDFKYWLETDVLIEINREKFFEFLAKRILSLNIKTSSLKKMKAYLEKNIEIRYTLNFDKTKFRIYQYLRRRRNKEKDLINKISQLTYSNSISDLYFDPNKVTATGRCTNKSKIFLNSYEINIPRKENLIKIKDFWVPSEMFAKEFLHKSKTNGFDVRILKEALDIMNYSTTSFINFDGILLLRKVDFIVAIAPMKF